MSSPVSVATLQDRIVDADTRENFAGPRVDLATPGAASVDRVLRRAWFFESVPFLLWF